MYIYKCLTGLLSCPLLSVCLFVSVCLSVCRFPYVGIEQLRAHLSEIKHLNFTKIRMFVSRLTDTELAISTSIGDAHINR